MSFSRGRMQPLDVLSLENSAPCDSALLPGLSAEGKLRLGEKRLQNTPFGQITEGPRGQFSLGRAENFPLIFLLPLSAAGLLHVKAASSRTKTREQKGRLIPPADLGSNGAGSGHGSTLPSLASINFWAYAVEANKKVWPPPCPWK